MHSTSSVLHVNLPWGEVVVAFPDKGAERAQVFEFGALTALAVPLMLGYSAESADLFEQAAALYRERWEA